MPTMSMVRQSGHALWLALFLSATAGLGLFFLFSAGQLTADKSRISNTADAAAYSGALWRARVLNYDAYSNRAILANELGIAQTLTLDSWTRYLSIYLERINDYTQNIPYVGQATKAAKEGSAELSSAMTSYSKIDIADREVHKALLTASQQIMHASAHAIAVQRVVNEVAKANDPNFKAQVLLQELTKKDGFQNFTRRYQGNDRQRFANLVLDSRDGFTRDRPASPFKIFFIGGNSCWSPTTPEFRKRGSTSLTNLDRWDAVDTHSAHIRYWRGIRCRRAEIPMGWAGDQAAGDNDSGGSFARRDIVNGEFGASAGTNGNAHRSADSDKESQDGFSGIASVYELDYANIKDQDDPRARIAVMVKTSATRTAHKQGLSSGSMDLEDNLEAGNLASVSAAEIYFKRPDASLGGGRADGKRELASLYNPYWQARLIEVQHSERLEALAWKHR